MANLPSGSHILSGAESQRLRSFCSSESFSASDLDQYADLLQKGTLEAVRADFQVRVEADGLEQARSSLAEVAYGPTKIPLYNYILQLIFLDPQNRARYLNYFRFLALEAKVPVDSCDLSGTTTFMHSISMKPYLEIEVADILLEAGAEINHRNRYGCVAAHDIVMIMDFTPAGKKKTLDALRYFVSKGGDVFMADGDGITPARIAMKFQSLIPEMASVLAPESPNAQQQVHTPSAATYSAGSAIKAKKVGRNDPCSCGSKKTFKVCCGKN